MISRGIRNNNPGNIEHRDDWVGLAEEQDDERFCTFSHAKYGVRAMCKIFFSYARRDVRTIEKIISTWAPPHENNTEQYIKNVSSWTGIGTKKAPDLSSAEDLANLCMAIARQENGTIGFDKSVYLEGARLALQM